jgi:hypothetical protein
MSRDAEQSIAKRNQHGAFYTRGGRRPLRFSNRGLESYAERFLSCGVRRSEHSGGGPAILLRRSISNRAWQSPHLYAGRSFVCSGNNGRRFVD